MQFYKYIMDIISTAAGATAGSIYIGFWAFLLIKVWKWMWCAVKAAFRDITGKEEDGNEQDRHM